MAYIDLLKNLGLSLELVQSEQNGTVHYKNKGGLRLILYPDGSYKMELEGRAEKRLNEK